MGDRVLYQFVADDGGTQGRYAMKNYASERAAIAARLATIKHLSSGIGDKTSPCSIAAVNLALSGRLTDVTPACAHPMICPWVMAVQDDAPAEIRDSVEWRAALPLLAGSVEVPDHHVRQVLISWAWRVLGYAGAVTAVPASARAAWSAMLAAPGDVELALAAANAVTAAADDIYDHVAHNVAMRVAHAAYAARVAVCLDLGSGYAAQVAYYVARIAPSVWHHADLPGTLRALCTPEVTP